MTYADGITTIVLNGVLTIIGLSTEEKPTDCIKEGTQLLEVDTKKVFIFYKGKWY